MGTNSGKRTERDSQIGFTAPGKTVVLSERQSAPSSAEKDRWGKAGTPREFTEFRGWKISKQFPTESGEADIFLVDKNGDKRILKLYRYGISPKDEVMEKIRNLCRESPDLFIHIESFGGDPSWKRYYEIQEYLPFGSLKNRLDKGPFNQEQTRLFVERLAMILSKMHDADILHLDIKPNNILLRQDDPPTFVLADFGISSILSAEFSKKFTTEKGTFAYQSPESFSGVVGKPADWWSLGVMVLEFLTGKNPFENLQRQVVCYQLFSKGVPLPPSIPKTWVPLIKGLLIRDPEKRWGAEQVKR